MAKLDTRNVLDCIAEVTGKRNWDNWIVNFIPSQLSQNYLETIEISYHDLKRKVRIDWMWTKEDEANAVRSAITELVNEYSDRTVYSSKDIDNSAWQISLKRYRELIEHENVYNQIMKLVSASTKTSTGETK